MQFPIHYLTPCLTMDNQCYQIVLFFFFASSDKSVLVKNIHKAVSIFNYLCFCSSVKDAYIHTKKSLHKNNITRVPLS